MASPQSKSRAVTFFWVSILLSAVTPFVPIVKWINYPFDLLNTHVHETFHALAAVATGGAVLNMKVFATTDGVTMTMGGIGAFITGAGYLGASILGAFITRFSTNEKNSHRWLLGLGIGYAISTVLWLRGDVVGLIAGLFWIVLLVGASQKLKGDSLIFLAQWIGIQQCLNSIKSLRDLIMLSSNPSVRTDAMAMQQMTGIPSIVWAILWLGIGVAGIVVGAVHLHRTASTPNRRS